MLKSNYIISNSFFKLQKFFKVYGFRDTSSDIRIHRERMYQRGVYNKFQSNRNKIVITIKI